MQLVLVSGLSGAGKSVALRVLEDGGYYCIDNLPANLLMETVDFLDEAGHDRAAVSIDARSAALPALPQHIDELRKRGVDTRVLYLEANSSSLLRRFSETRRRHPLATDGSTLEAESLTDDVPPLAWALSRSSSRWANVSFWLTCSANVNESPVTRIRTSPGGFG